MTTPIPIDERGDAPRHRGRRRLGRWLALVVVSPSWRRAAPSPTTAAPRAHPPPRRPRSTSRPWGLWDDGPCDDSLEPLTIGLTATFATAVFSAEANALALEASGEAFNQRGGANGHCIKVVTCDEEADPNVALECVRTLDEAGVAVTVNDSSSATPGPELGEAYQEAGIARFAISAATPDLSDPNSYPFDAGGIGTAMVMPQALVDEGITKVANIRVDLPAASAVIGLFQEVYADDGIDFVADIPVPAGTTDYSQFILAAEGRRGRGGRPPARWPGGGPGPPGGRAARIGPGVLDQPRYAELRRAGGSGRLLLADHPQRLDDAGHDRRSRRPSARRRPGRLRRGGAPARDARGQPDALVVGLYALLTILRDAETEDFSRENITALIQASGPIDMLGLTADWTPNKDNPGAFPRTGNGSYTFWRWDRRPTTTASRATWCRPGRRTPRPAVRHLARRPRRHLLTRPAPPTSATARPGRWSSRRGRSAGHCASRGSRRRPGRPGTRPRGSRPSASG